MNITFTGKKPDKGFKYSSGGIRKQDDFVRGNNFEQIDLFIHDIKEEKEVDQLIEYLKSMKLTLKKIKQKDYIIKNVITYNNEEIVFNANFINFDNLQFSGSFEFEIEYNENDLKLESFIKEHFAYSDGFSRKKFKMENEHVILYGVWFSKQIVSIDKIHLIVNYDYIETKSENKLFWISQAR